MGLGEAQQPRGVAPPKRVDRLGDVARDRQVPPDACDELDQATLRRARVLELIEEQQAEAVMQARGDRLVLGQQMAGCGEHVLEVERARRPRQPGIASPYRGEEWTGRSVALDVAGPL